MASPPLARQAAALATALLPFALTPAAAQTITSVTPTSASQVTDVVITGSGFDAASQVFVDGVPEPVVSQSPTQLVIQPGLADPGFADVTVTTSAGSVTATGGLAFQPTLRFTGGSIGGTLEVELENGGPGFYAFLIDAAPLPVPIDLGPLFYFTLQIDPSTAVALPGSTGFLPQDGSAAVSVAVPMLPALVGLPLFGQGLAQQGFFDYSFTNLETTAIQDFVPPPPAAGDVIISEVMQNPEVVPDFDGEWFELYNTRAFDVDIEGWTLTDNGGTHVIDAGGAGLVVPAGGYLVLGRDADPAQNGGIPVAYSFGDEITIGNATDGIVLESPDQVVIDSVQWDDGQTFPDPDGRSMTLDLNLFNPPVAPGDLAQLNDSGANWCEASSPIAPLLVDFGTPAAANDLCQPPPVPPASVTYPDPVAVYEEGTPIDPNVPTVVGVATSWSATPPLPPGLVLDASTGVISGTPSAPAPQTDHVVTAANAAGVTTTQVTITVLPAFEVVSISVPDGAVWEVNRPIEVVFKEAVDFGSVSLNTIRIEQPSGQPAIGEFFLDAPDTVVFQPACPTLDDFSDAGFTPGGVTYAVTVPGEDTSPLTVQSADGVSLPTTADVTFTTPATLTPAQLFFDPVVGPPVPIVREVGSSEPVATRLELGDDPGNAIYFELDLQQLTITQPSDVPLNLYSDPGSAVDYVLELNQPVNPSSSNVDPERVFLERELSPGVWERIPSSVELVANCTASGATLLLEPLGILPQLSRVRAVISPAFEDLVGERNLVPLDAFAVATTLVFSAPGLVPPDDLADEFFESFDLTVFEDTSTPFLEPFAEWGDGVLKASLDFGGTGGPNGDFDVLVPAGVTIQIDTTAFTIFGGPNALMGINTTSQTVLGGELQVRNLRVEAGGTLRAQGPNPLSIRATGDVEVFGDVIVDGAPVNNVATLNTGNQPETGASGNCGGGRGGTGSFLTTTSTPKGGDGFGVSNVPDLGGRGGESGFSSGGKNNRRPGGGGGGSFGPDAIGQPGSGFGLVAEPGHDGNPNSTSAITFTKPAKGGPPAPLPFVDALANNDFFGRALDPLSGAVIPGELQGILAASGGGAGGDAIPGDQFPSPNWIPASDEKGAGGGGGAGGLQILCLGVLRISGAGRITATGGDGGAGENTIFNDRVGGGSGGGGGGHVVLQAEHLDLTASSTNAIRAFGGRGGAGANEVFNTTNAGGDGGPGIIQIHTSSIALPVAATVQGRTVPDPVLLLPLFEPRSRARSKWIALGHPEHDPIGPDDALTFFYGGTDPGSGLVLDQDGDGQVDDLPPLLGPTVVQASPALPFIDVDGRTLVVDAGPLVNTLDDIYLRNTALLRDLALVLAQAGNPAVAVRFDVAAAAFDPGTGQLALTVSSAGPALTAFDPPGPEEYTLLPRFFRVRTNGLPDSLPPSASIAITFQGTGETPGGLPDDAGILVDWTGDAALLGMSPVKFFRFEVLFDVDAQGAGLSASTPLPELLFQRNPFRF